MSDPWAEYIKALHRCSDAVKLTAFHTMETARQTEIVATQTSLVAWAIKEYLKKSGGKNV